MKIVISVFLVLVLAACVPSAPLVSSEPPEPAQAGRAVMSAPRPTVALAPTPLPHCMVVADVLNVRKNPNANAEHAGVWVELDDQLTVLSDVGDWLEIETPGGTTGFVRSKYCK